MSMAWHENVRLMVSQLLLNIIYNLIRRRFRVVGQDLGLVILRSFIEKFRDEPELTVMLMPQEIYVTPTEKYRIDSAFGGFMAFDYKSSESEFDVAVKDAKSKYLPYLPKVRYYVITNWHSWWIHKINRESGLSLVKIYEGDRDGAVNILEQIISREVKEIKIPPYPKSIEVLFTINSERLLSDLKKIFDHIKDGNRVRPLFEAYKGIMDMLYKGLSREEITDLFMKHTLMHMITMASLSTTLNLTGDPMDLCSGALLTSDSRSLDVALPYLNWWKISYSDLPREMRSKIKGVTHDVSLRALLIDWELGGEEDVFRRLYEVLVEPETRRRIGEYYTPLWLVDRILSEFRLRNKLVMDPFCGSGTFLVRAFYRKVSEGEDPEKAYAELLGLDVNPLAVAIARAELIISYRKVAGRIPQEPPHIYHIDTLAMWFGGRFLALTDPKYMGVVDTFVSHMTAKIYEISDLINEVIKRSPEDVLRSISKIERALVAGIKLALMSGSESLEDQLKSYILSSFGGESVIERKFREIVKESEFAARLAKLVEEYGDGVWAIAIVSAAMPSLANVMKPHIIVTNPPWVPTTEYQANYVEELRREAVKMFKKMKIRANKAASIVTGSDIACMALCKSIQLAEKGVGFVMNREQAFYSRSPMRAGILLTYAVIKNLCDKNCEVKLIDVDYDAFGHGIYPALVIVKKNDKEGG